MHGSSTFGSRAARRRSERQLAAERLHAVTSLGRPGWVPVDPSEDGEAADQGRHRAARSPRAEGGRDDQPTGGPPLVRDTVRARLLDRLLLHRLPATVRSARWSVPAAAVVALFVLAGLLALVVAVRTAAATPGMPVPARPSGTASPAGTPEGAAVPADGAPGVRQAREGSAADSGPASVQQPVSGPRPPAVAQPVAGNAPAGDVVVHVVGQVAAPGLVRVPAGSRVDDAVRAAGGATAGSDLARVNLARPVVDGEQLFVPRPGEEVPPSSGSVSTSGAPVAGPAASPGGPMTALAGGLVDLNTATVEQLDTLPGIGPVLAQRVIDWRTQNGRFTAVDELAEVSGIGTKLLDGLRPLVTV